MFRVYFDDSRPSIGLWVVDDGNIENQQFFDTVVAHSFGVSKENLMGYPISWMEYSDAKLKIINRTAVIR